MRDNLIKFGDTGLYNHDDVVASTVAGIMTIERTFKVLSNMRAYDLRSKLGHAKRHTDGKSPALL
jgi:hypothetical protein